MEQTQDLSASRLADAWAELQAFSSDATPLHADANRLAFADPEFLLRRETRGLRIQLEMLKPEISQHEQGIENTIVVFGSARFEALEQASAALAAAETNLAKLNQAERGGLEAAQDALDSKAARDALAVARRQMRNAHYYEQARQFARLVATYSHPRPAAEQLFICTGGGPGIMEAANRGAQEMGALNVGLNIVLPHEQGSNPYVSPSLNFKFHYFALRKMHFMMRAKALVAFPGGFGTLDELFEVITLVQTGKAKPVPIILFGSDYWKRLVNFEVLIEEGTISPDDLKLFQYVDEPQVAWDAIRNFYKL
ncbi:TIGR00730 family Rossman fold protein [Polaromonas sp.]|uniref:LOG family protein n=1 Tax=Polaromonas sp. TaxID=1869339 RepID=UPI00286BBCAA|nr:TIGR00730 family Rossman fold protein [Polaromonas sp.]